MRRAEDSFVITVQRWSRQGRTLDDRWVVPAQPYRPRIRQPYNVARSEI